MGGVGVAETNAVTSTCVREKKKKPHNLPLLKSERLFPEYPGSLSPLTLALAASSQDAHTWDISKFQTSIQKNKKSLFLFENQTSILKQDHFSILFQVQNTTQHGQS